MTITKDTEIADLLNTEQVELSTDVLNPCKDYFEECKKLINTELSKGLSQSTCLINNTSPLYNAAKDTIKIQQETIESINNLQQRIKVAATNQRIKELLKLQQALKVEIQNLNSKLYSINNLLPDPEKQFSPQSALPDFDIDTSPQEYFKINGLIKEYTSKLDRVEQSINNMGFNANLF